jgi:penicillin-binding protein 1A
MVHFTNHDNGQGANMALPIWALFMKKVYADNTLNVSQGAFERPAYMSEPLNCDGMTGQGVTPTKRKKSDLDDF